MLEIPLHILATSFGVKHLLTRYSLVPFSTLYSHSGTRFYAEIAVDAHIKRLLLFYAEIAIGK